MIDEIRSAPLLDGVRGGVPVDRDELVDLLLRIGGENGLLVDCEDYIAELDLNPIIAGPDGLCAVDARVLLAAQDARRPAFAPVTDLRPLLEPRNVAVAGASASRITPGNLFIDNLRAFGFQGGIYPIHPSADRIQGLQAYARLDQVPEPVDYAYLAVAAEQCEPLIAAGAGRVAFAQVMSGGFAERAGGEALEQALLDSARAGAVRLLGPNTMGAYSPRGHLSYIGGFEQEPGGVSVLSQSGGLCTDIVRRGARRGLRFRCVLSLGNSADVGAAELLPGLLADEQTRVIGLYLEDPHRGRELLQQLTAARGRKPVVLLVGGQTEQGNRAASSHTGALAGDGRAWQALARQVEAPLTGTLDEFIDVLLAMQTLRPRAGRVTRDVVLFGNGGGTSVLAADAFGREGLAVRALPDETRAALEALSLPAGASVANPIDVPANVLQREEGAIARRIVAAVFAGASLDAFVIHVNVPVILNYAHVDILGNLMEATLQAASGGERSGHVVLVLRSDGEPEMEAQRGAMAERARAAGIPVYFELVEAARALAGFAVHEAALARVQHQRSR
ncbi:MAG: CoA-binding protein [Gammaproteobacteria bacterium]|nr:CoA-binding protein [Gammaproteobacteria bacterium]